MRRMIIRILTLLFVECAVYGPLLRHQSRPVAECTNGHWNHAHSHVCYEGALIEFKVKSPSLDKRFCNWTYHLAMLLVMCTTGDLQCPLFPGLSVAWRLVDLDELAAWRFFHEVH